MVQESGRVFFPPSLRLLGRSRRLPLVLYTHATMLEKIQVPSEYGGHEWILGAAAALYYGFAVAMPDQPGMGGDSQAYHPFCHGKSLAYATLDALPALERLVREDPYLSQRNYGWDGRLYLMGYSEGAYTALASVKELEAHPEAYRGPFTLQGSACMAGPFDLSGTTRKDIINPVRPYRHCFYLPYVIMAYQGIYGDLLDPRQAFAPALLEEREDGNLVQWVDGCLDGLAVDALIGRRLGVPGDAVVLRSILNPDWVARELDDPAYATSGVRKLLLENDLWGGWRPTRPILFCQSEGDHDVSIQNTLTTMAGLGAEIRKAGADPARLLAFLPIGAASDHITHVQGALVAIPAAFNWIYSGMPVN
jgi:pimeloyl-ACP methyl ester carboxylesterase